MATHRAKSFSLDCNTNGVVDECDIRRSDSPDCNTNGVPDECDTTPPIIIYVHAAAMGNSNGTSWEDAYLNLQDALADAADNAPPTEIWVAAATYRPAGPAGDRTAPFQLVDCVGVYGGFAGSETARVQRDPVSNLTILSGDLNGDDDPNFGSNGENCYHVVTVSGTGVGTMLDGCTISAGNADASAPPHDRGGGMFNSNGSPTIRDCAFVGNQSRTEGGGMYNAGSEPRKCEPHISGCTFVGNRSIQRGGGATNQSARPRFVGCRFDGNRAEIRGGGMANIDRAETQVISCTFKRNEATNNGGAVFNQDSLPSLIGCSFVGNRANRGAAIRNLNNFRLTLTNCAFSGNEASIEGAAIHSTSTDPNHLFELRLMGCSFSRNTAGGRGGGVFNQSATILASNSIFWGNSDAGGSDESAQLDIDSGTLAVDYSCIQGLTGALGGTGNIGDDPLFVREPNDGGDGWGDDSATPAVDEGANDDFGDLRLSAGSPCIDTGANELLPCPLNEDIDGNPRILNAIVNMGAYEGFDCNNNSIEDVTDIALGTSQDCNTNTTPDECDTPEFVSALSRVANPNGPDGACNTAADASACHSEPHTSRITQMRFTFDPAGPMGCLLSIDQATCPNDSFVPYSGASVRTCEASGNELVCMFSPALENARTYRFNLTGASVKIRGLIGDVNSDGLVNSTDRSVVVGVWTGSGFSCATDVNSDGVTNATDRSIVVGAWTDTANNCAPCPSGSGRAAAGPTGAAWNGAIRTPRAPFQAVAAAETDLSGGSDQPRSRGAAIEVRPSGAEAPAETLITGQRYEVRYIGALHPVEAYALRVSSSSCETPPIREVEAADTGDWAGTGLFGFAAMPTSATPEGPQGLARYGMMLDDQVGAGGLADTDGPLCTFTAGGSGELMLQLWLSWVDEAAAITHESAAEVSLIISD